MDKKTFTEWSGRIAEIGKVLEKLPQEVRQEAFQLLKDYVTEQKIDAAQGRGGKAGKPASKVDGSRESFFASFTHDKPADNVKLIAAWFYREYGTDPFSRLQEIRERSSSIMQGKGNSNQQLTERQS